MDKRKTYTRCFGIAGELFDYFKEFQRRYLQEHGINLSNNQVLAVILREHSEQLGYPIMDARS